MPLAILAVGLLLAAEPYWLSKSPEQWTDAELQGLLTQSPWAQMATPPGLPSLPVQTYLATASPIRIAEQERERRARLKRPPAEPTEADALAQEYREWLEQNRQSHLVLAIRIPNTKAFSDDREVRRMEEECVIRVGRRKIKMTGHFPPTPSDPYLRLAFPREVQPNDRTLNFDLYLPGVSIPYRSVEFSLKDAIYAGKLEF